MRDTARIGRRVFQGLLDQSPTSERCMETFHLQRTRFELVVEGKLRRRPYSLIPVERVERAGSEYRNRLFDNPV
jgi:hypothetical protein